MTEQASETEGLRLAQNTFRDRPSNRAAVEYVRVAMNVFNKDLDETTYYTILEEVEVWIKERDNHATSPDNFIPGGRVRQRQSNGRSHDSQGSRAADAIAPLSQ